MAEKSATKIYNSIHSAMGKSNVYEFIHSLNLLGRNMGVTRLELVSGHYGYEKFIENLYKLELDIAVC